MMRKTGLILLTGLLAVAVPALAAQKAETKFGLSDPNAPIAISADRFDADQNNNTLIYTGNAVVRQGDVYLHTDRLKVVAPDGKTPDKIYADGHVVLTTPNGTATGADGIYDVTPRIVTIRGHVVLVKDNNVMRGETVVVDLIAGTAKMGAAEKGGRIQGLFTPKSLSSEKK
jgi:lipopolysaccharide export system protein LptA